MGKGRKKSRRARSAGPGPSAAVGNHAKERHRRFQRGISVGLNDLKASLQKPKPISSKHKTYIEFVDNTDKKLEFEFTPNRIPPDLFEFVPIGNPALTDKCKELSREQGAMIYIVAVCSSPGDAKQLYVHTDRVGHHFRQNIVEEARKKLPQGAVLPIDVERFWGARGPIPKDQKELHEQADQHIRELFPRIPNFDRQQIINHAFDMTKLRAPGRPPVGVNFSLPLTSRVQLAVLAHIRHVHTIYDQLLRKTDRDHARELVEEDCLNYLVKWRGDEENGRDQMTQIMREIIIISDSESDDEDDDDLDDEDSDSEDELSEPRSHFSPPGDDVEVKDGLSKPDELPDLQSSQPAHTNPPKENASLSGPRAPRKVKKKKAKKKTAKAKRGLARYYAALEKAEEQHGYETNEQAPSTGAVVMSRSASDGSRLHQYAPLPVYPDPNAQFRNRDALRYDDSPPERLPMTGYYQQGSRLNAAPYYDEAQPIVGSPVTRDGGLVVRRVRHQDEDLKDHLVKSIEPTSPTSPDVSSFPLHPQGPSHWEQHRIRSAPEVQYERPRPVESNIPGFRHYPGHHDLRPRDQVLVDTGFSSQPIIPARAPPPAYRPNAPPAPAGSGLRRDPEVIWIDDDEDDVALLRTKARPIVIQDEYGQAQQVMVDSRPPPQPLRTVAPARYDSNHLDAHHARGEERLTGPSGNDMSQGFIEIVRVSNKFPKRHESQSFLPDTSGYVPRPSNVIQYRQENVRDTSGALVPPPSYFVPRTRVERVVAMVEEPLRQSPYQPDVPRPLGSIPVAVQRQERVVGLEYVPAGAQG
ncbi:DUF2293 domain containing protein [Naviculisporaceae sp. PSN 640]